MWVRVCVWVLNGGGGGGWGGDAARGVTVLSSAHRNS